MYGVPPIRLSAMINSPLTVSFAVISGPATISISNSVSNLTVTGVGNVVVEASQAGNATYSAAVPVDESFTVNPATLTITANDDSKTYGTLTSFSSTAFTSTPPVLFNGDTITAVTETSTGAPVSATKGTYNIVPSAAMGTGLGNYTIVYANGSLTVNPATLTITANDDSKTYGTLTSFSSTAFTSTPPVLFNGDTITGVTETSTGAPASATKGTYNIVPSRATGTGLGNYTIVYVKAT